MTFLISQIASVQIHITAYPADGTGRGILPEIVSCRCISYRSVVLGKPDLICGKFPGIDLVFKPALKPALERSWQGKL